MAETLYTESVSHIEQIAWGMMKRYKKPLEQCDDYINNPLTTDAGKKFWTLVRQQIENLSLK